MVPSVHPEMILESTSFSSALWLESECGSESVPVGAPNCSLGPTSRPASRRPCRRKGRKDTPCCCSPGRGLAGGQQKALLVCPAASSMLTLEVTSGSSRGSSVHPQALTALTCQEVRTRFCRCQGFPLAVVLKVRLVAAWETREEVLGV